MPECLIVAVLTLFILSIMFLVALCLGLIIVAWVAFIEWRARARYRTDVARGQATTRRAARITDHRMNLQ